MIVEAEIPRLDGFSREFLDLINKLLEKDPLKRINWDELKSHSFWVGGKRQYEFTKRIYPIQP
jgi:serine/threonine-protein kinase ULK4